MTAGRAAARLSATNQTSEVPMIRKYPARVLGITALVAIAALALSYPGRNDKSGALYYLSAIGWFGFLLSLLVLIVLAVVVAVGSRRARSA